MKPWPKSIDEWTHWLHGADGNAVARDETVGPPRGMQWVARPLWSRHHNTVPSVSAWVSARGRVFAIVDEAPPGMHGDAPDQWALVARDAFNGILLWRIPLPEWGWRAWSADWHCRFTVPTHIPRRLVASGDRLYATLGFNAPLSELDAATGEVLRTFEDTALTDEILCHDGLLILSVNQGPQKPGRPGEAEAAPVRKSVAALNAESGEMLWKTGDYGGLRSKTGSMDGISHLTLAAGGGRVFFVDGDAIVGLDLKSGRQAWRVPRPEVPEHKMRYNIRITDMCSLVYHGGRVYFAQLSPDRKIDWRETRGRLHAFSAETGKELWSRPCASWGWGHPADVFVVDGLVWVHSYQSRPRTPRQCRPRSARDLPDSEARTSGSLVLGLDPATGEVRRKISNLEAFDNGHHHRCYRNKATTRWLMTSYRGLEFLSWTGGQPHLSHWVRGTCRLGAFPCNGLVYATPHPCDCYITAKLNGLLALTPTRKGRGSRDEGRADNADRLEKGPAYGAIADRKSQTANVQDWPTYRHDPQRSGSTPEAVGGKLDAAWAARVGGTPSACTAAGGTVFVASVPTHEVCAFDAEDGQAAWRFAAGGPVDTPPTVCGGLAIFGCTDGWVYAVRASDGVLAWRFRAAPRERLVGAFGHLESAWPVHGSVLARGDRVYVVAGRSSFLDGGLFAWCLEARTGKVAAEKNLAASHAMAVDIGRDQANYYGTLPDILVADGEAIRMRGLPLFGDLDRGTKASGGALRPTAGFLDGSWFNRTHWFLDGKPLGELLVYDDQAVYGVKAYATRDANRGFHNPGTKGYTLFARERRADAKKARREDARGTKQSWSVRLPVRVTSMVLAGPTLVVAGTPDIIAPDDPWAAYRGRRGGVLMALSAADGSTLSARKLDSAPVYDGLAAARGRLYIPTQDGRVLCFRAR